MANVIEQATSESDTTSIPFVNKGKEFTIPIIRVSDIRIMQMKRSKLTDPDAKEMEASIVLAQSILSKIDKSVTKDMIEDWEYADFLRFIKTLWGKNVENFRGILPTLPTTVLDK